MNGADVLKTTWDVLIDSTYTFTLASPGTDVSSAMPDIDGADVNGSVKAYVPVSEALHVIEPTSRITSSPSGEEAT